ncbi:MAG TPA: TIGR00730 family Rossman fold protein, partial [Solirubrobacteraceae bacterium]|nr:TIGR00730 family Rossman fold protein [Solirubrobacteraceae bacterium]
MSEAHPRHPSSSDEELLEAESATILAELTDAQRLLRIQDELRNGFTALSRIGKAVSIFGSARTPEDDPDYQLARETARVVGESGLAIITGGGPGIME